MPAFSYTHKTTTHRKGHSMQVQILGNKALISSAFAETTAVGLQLGINLAGRQLGYHRVGGCAEFAAQFEGPGPAHQAIEVYPSDDPCEPCWNDRATVVFFADTNEDVEALHGIVYECFEKDQLLLLLVPAGSLKTMKSLCDVRSR
jgi:hypothetical protein